MSDLPPASTSTRPAPRSPTVPRWSPPTGSPGLTQDRTEDPQAEIESPAKIIRIGAMVKQLLEEVRNTDARRGVPRPAARDLRATPSTELKTSLSPELGEELDSLSFDFSGDELPSEAELRMAKAQLVGWLEGLFHGIQATLVAQQMAARQQLEGMRGELPGGRSPSGRSGPRSRLHLIASPADPSASCRASRPAAW